MNQLKTFVADHLAVPDEIDKAFVVKFECSDDHEEPWFRYFVTTRRLLQMACDAKVIHADSTMKTTIQGYPLLACGTSDAARHFHLFGLMLSSNEKTADFECMFESLRFGVETVYNKVMKPEILISDAAHAIQNGCQKVFGPLVVTMCWFHVVLNFHKRKFNHPENEDLMKDDLRHLHLAYSEDVFEIGSQLFLKKWEQQEPEFTANFKTQYLELNRNWFNGVSVRAPKENNQIERFNGTMKQHQTFYERRSLAMFKNDLMDIVAGRSAEYINNKTFKKDIETDEKVLDAGLKYAESEKSAFIKSDDDGNTHFFVFAGSDENQITQDDVEEFRKHEYDSFDDFKAKAFAIHQITFPTNPDEWKNSTCTCPMFYLKYMCKHIVAMAYRLEIIKKPTPPSKADMPLERKRKGRPPKATPALVID